MIKSSATVSAGDSGTGSEARKRDVQDRDRRWRRCGPEGLSDVELLILLLGTGGGRTAGEIATELLDRFVSLDRMARTRPEILAGVRGMGPIRAVRLLAGLELGRRGGGIAAGNPLRVQRPEDLHELLSTELRGLDRERFVALYLDTRHRLLMQETVSVGSLNASLVHPREVFKAAIQVSAAALVVAHNHPSGCARPSGDDLDLTCRLDRCGELLGISLLDHLVVGETEIVSIREYGWPVSRAQEARGG